MKTDSFIVLRPGEYDQLSEDLKHRITTENTEVEKVLEGDKYYFDHDIFHEILEDIQDEGWEDDNPS